MRTDTRTSKLKSIPVTEKRLAKMVMNRESAQLRKREEVVKSRD